MTAAKREGRYVIIPEYMTLPEMIELLAIYKQVELFMENDAQVKLLLADFK